MSLPPLPVLIRDLERLGMSQAAIGEACGTSGPTICRIKLGRRRARYEVGKKIEELHGKVVRAGQEQSV